MHTILNIPTRVGVLAFALLVSVTASRAQITVEEEISTDSVDLFSEPEVQDRKSPTLAMVQSLLIPGLGHQYLNRPHRALTYFSTDLLLLFGAIFCESYSRHLENDARTLAWNYADARGGSGADDSYWQDIGNYLDAAGYNRVQELNRTPENKYIEPNLQWAWVDEEYMDEYVAVRDDAKDIHLVSTFFIGGMVLNRLVAFIDTRITTRRRRSSRHSSHIEVEPSVDVGTGTVGVHLSKTF